MGAGDAGEYFRLWGRSDTDGGSLGGKGLSSLEQVFDSFAA